MTKRIYLSRSFLVLLLLFGFTRVAVVQAQGSVLEEITVTAQKREQSIQDVGISITAFSGEQMRTLGFEDSFDIARMTPGVISDTSDV